MKIASRKSALALWQSEHIKSLIQDHLKIPVEIVGYKTKGDVILDTPLSKIGGKGLFTKELEDAMLSGLADLAVHSLKDVPMYFPEGLKLCAISKREKCNDCFISYKYSSFDELPKNAKVGTTSLRRMMQLKILRPDLDIISLRGNVNTRLSKLQAGEFDAIILAVAGISRLGIDVPHKAPFSLDDMIPAVGQGALGIECRDDKNLIDQLSFLNDKNAFIETKIERDFTTTLNGGCQVPIGINAQIIDDSVVVRGIVGLIDGSEFIKEKEIISIDEFDDFGVKFAQKFIQKGAKELLDKALKMANL